MKIMTTQQILKALKKSGISMYKVAKDTAINKVSLHNYLHGKQLPNERRAKEIKQYYEKVY